MKDIPEVRSVFQYTHVSSFTLLFYSRNHTYFRVAATDRTALTKARHKWQETGLKDKRFHSVFLAVAIYVAVLFFFVEDEVSNLDSKESTTHIPIIV